jgi:uncharacterized protein YuzE
LNQGGGKNMNKNIKVFYDRESDVLYISKEGREEKFVELFPGINVEMNEKGEFIGIEILNASKMLRDVVEPLSERKSAGA